jgi:very-short-patch-repair endonuclease
MSEQKKNKSPFKKDGMFNEATPLVFELAKDLRRNMTDAEIVLWGYLKAGVKGLKFRRQHPLGIYVADFYCHKLKLIIELDGRIHDIEEVKVRDKKREDDLMEWGYKIKRFRNEEVMKQLKMVIDEINSIAENLINSSK